MVGPGLNTRETALLVWLVAFFVFVLTKSDIRSSIGSLLKTLFGSAFLTGVIVSAAAYAVGTILLLQHFGHWEPEMTKVAVLWFVGFALVAVFNTKRVDAPYYRRLVMHNLTLAAVVELIANLHTFPLPVELLLVPLAFLLVGTQAVAESSPEYASARKVLAWCLTLLGLASISFSLAYLVDHFRDVVTTEKVEEFLLPLVLTAFFVPFLVALGFVTFYQTMLHMVRFGLRDSEALYSFARRSIIRTCGLSLERAQLFEERFRGRLWGAAHESEVTSVLEEFREAWQARRANDKQAA